MLISPWLAVVPAIGALQAYALSRKPEIQTFVAAVEKQRLEANKVSATRVIEENRRIPTPDADDGRPIVPVFLLPEGARVATK